MKYKYFILTTVLLIAGSVLTGCDKNRDNKADAKEEVQKANQALLDAQTQYEKEWQQFKSDADLKISNNEKRIDEFKAEIKKTGAKFKAKYSNKVLTLEQKNIELKKMLNDFHYEGKESWETFKHDFNNNVDSVETALGELFSNKD